MQTQTNDAFSGKNGTTTYLREMDGRPNALPDTYVSRTISVENGVYRFSASCGATQQGDSELKIGRIRTNEGSSSLARPPQAKVPAVEVTNGSMTVA